MGGLNPLVVRFDQVFDDLSKIAELINVSFMKAARPLVG
jgi:hypothetical protein